MLKSEWWQGAYWTNSWHQDGGPASDGHMRGRMEKETHIIQNLKSQVGQWVNMWDQKLEGKAIIIQKKMTNECRWLDSEVSALEGRLGAMHNRDKGSLHSAPGSNEFVNSGGGRICSVAENTCSSAHTSN
jgi:hypothetical protein